LKLLADLIAFSTRCAGSIGNRLWGKSKSRFMKTGFHSFEAGAKPKGAPSGPMKVTPLSTAYRSVPRELC
jgi:hypothetical protein